MFVQRDEFIAEVQRDLPEAQQLTEIERSFTALISKSFAGWGNTVSESLGLGPRPHWGLPIGSSAARVFANLLLLRWDRAVLEGLTPLFYGRYVDDMILVLRDPGTLQTKEQLFAFLAVRLMGSDGRSLLGKTDLDHWQVQLGAAYAASSELVIHSEKLRVFSLEGPTGVDFLDTLDAEARGVSSERRLLPDPELLGDSFAARLLTAAESPGEEADSFRQAGMLTVRRFAWSVNLRKAEILGLDLPAKEWTAQRREFYRFARAHVVCPDRLLNHADTLGRLVGLAIACGDWTHARDLVGEIRTALRRIRRIFENPTPPRKEVSGDAFRINGKPVGPVQGAEASGHSRARAQAWVGLERYLGRVAQQALARAWTVTPRKGGADPIAAARPVVGKVAELLGETVSANQIWELALNLLRADLGRRPLAEALGLSLDGPLAPKAWLTVPRSRCSEAFLEEAFGGAANQHRFEWVTEFVRVAGCQTLLVSNPGRDISSYFLSTRPASPAAIACAVPETFSEKPTWSVFQQRTIPEAWASLAPTVRWARLLSALRGVATYHISGAQDGDQPAELVDLGGAPLPLPRLALTNMHVKDAWWEGAAAGRPVLTVERYRRLANLVNGVVKERPAPDYLLLPELAVPRHWARSVARFVNGAGINFITGVEYGHGDRLTGSTSEPTGAVANQVMMALIDERLRFPYRTELWQTKTRPAAGEEELLDTKFGRTWNGGLGASSHPRDVKPVYKHRGVFFGTLVCSELLNGHYRIAYQGKIDLLLVLCWNRDLETFDALVESAALDIHTYVALVNNGKYGETRLRVPAKEGHKRDVAKVRGGSNDYFVLAELDIHALRRFQSRHRNWPREGDPFKPVPEGFNLSALRRAVPD